MSGFARPPRQQNGQASMGVALREMIEIATDRVDWRDKFRIAAFDGVLRGEGGLGPARSPLHPARDVSTGPAAHWRRSCRLRAGHVRLDLRE